MLHGRCDLNDDLSVEVKIKKQGCGRQLEIVLPAGD